MQIPSEISDRMKDALKELMAAECDMLTEINPDFASHFTWGRVRVGDLLLSNRYSFEFGGNDDPPGGPEFDVI